MAWGPAPAVRPWPWPVGRPSEEGLQCLGQEGRFITSQSITSTPNPAGGRQGGCVQRLPPTPLPVPKAVHPGPSTCWWGGGFPVRPSKSPHVTADLGCICPSTRAHGHLHHWEPWSRPGDPPKEVSSFPPLRSGPEPILCQPGRGLPLLARAEEGKRSRGNSGPGWGSEHGLPTRAFLRLRVRRRLGGCSESNGAAAQGWPECEQWVLDPEGEGRQLGWALLCYALAGC